jgi:hypothetical protein
MADDVWSCLAGDDDVAGYDELRRELLRTLRRDQRTEAEQPAQQANLRSHSGTDHGKLLDLPIINPIHIYFKINSAAACRFSA